MGTFCFFGHSPVVGNNEFVCFKWFRYNSLCGSATKIVNFLKKLDPEDSFRIEMTEQLVDKL